LDVWAARLRPWNLIADTVLYFIRANSFYINGHPIDWGLWQTASIYGFFAFLFSALWTLVFEKKNSYLRLNAWLFVFSAFVLGFGSAREEYIYRMPLTFIGIPLAAGLIDKIIPRAFAWGKETVFPLIGAAGLIGVYWMARWNLLFFIILFLAVLILKNTPDRAVVVASVAAVIILLCIWIRDRSLSTKLSEHFMAQLFRPSGMIIAIFSVAALVAAAAVARDKQSWSSLLMGSFLIWSFLFTGFATVVQAVLISRNTRSLSSTLKDVAAIPGSTGDGRIMGPSYLWFWKHSVYDLSGITLDYYYSGQKRPRQCIERVHPDILVIDDDFKRRYLFRRGGANKTWEPIPLAALIAAPFSYLGTADGLVKGTKLDVYRISWPTNP
jgi:hypothetical protein